MAISSSSFCEIVSCKYLNTDTKDNPLLLRHACQWLTHAYWKHSKPYMENVNKSCFFNTVTQNVYTFWKNTSNIVDFKHFPFAFSLKILRFATISKRCGWMFFRNIWMSTTSIPFHLLILRFKKSQLLESF